MHKTVSAPLKSRKFFFLDSHGLRISRNCKMAPLKLLKFRLFVAVESRQVEQVLKGYSNLGRMFFSFPLYMHVCMYVCMYVCIYTLIYYGTSIPVRLLPTWSIDKARDFRNITQGHQVQIPAITEYYMRALR